MPRLYLARHPFTIRQLSALLVAVCIIPSILAVCTVLYLSYRREKDSTENMAIGITRALMQAIDRDLSVSTGILEALSVSPHLEEGKLGEFHQQASRLMDKSMQGTFILLDSYGRQVLNTSRPYGTILPPYDDPTEAKNIIASQRNRVSDLYLSQEQDRLVVSVTVPVQRKDRTSYALIMQFSPDQLDAILARQRIPDGWVAAALDSKGIVVARTRDSKRFIGKPATPGLRAAMATRPEGAINDRTLEGIPSVAVFSRSSLSNWAVVIGVHRSQFIQPMVASTAWTIAALVFLFSVGLFLAILIAERIARPVRNLASHAVALGYGREVVADRTYLHEADEVAQALEEASALLKKRTEERNRADAQRQHLLESKLKTEQNEAFLEGVFRESPDAVFLARPDGGIIRSNSEAMRMFALARNGADDVGIDDILCTSNSTENIRIRELLFSPPVKHAVIADQQIMARGPDGHLFPVDVMASPMQLAEGEVTIVTIRDVTERTKSEDALRQSETRFRSALENAPIGMAIVSLDGHWLEVNNAACEMLGYQKEELTRLTFQDVTYADDLPLDLDFSDGLLNGDIRSYQMEKRYVRKDGTIVPALLTGTLVRDTTGSPVHFIAQMLDISERRRSEEELTTLSNRLTLATRAGGIAVWEWNLRTGTLTWDERMWELYGRDPHNEPQGYELWRKGVHPDDVDRVENEVRSALERKGDFSSEFRIVRPDRQVRIIHADALVTVSKDGAPERMTGVNIDVTESRKREDAIRLALKEKDLLLKELYHRVKNNLQMMTSMFNLQVRGMPEGSARVALKEAAGRVAAMSLVHEKLYQSRNLTSIDLDNYVKELCDNLAQLGYSDQGRFEIKVDAVKVQIGIETAIPLGVILNELISNCFKHAFPDKRKGLIVVKIGVEDNTRVTLSVSDNGIGFPPGFDPKTCPSLGLRLVEALCRQLRGLFSINNLGGAHATLVFCLDSSGDKSSPTEAGVSQ